MVNKDYMPEDWCWFVGEDDTQAWSSSAGGYVPAANVPANAGITRIASESDLSDVLRVCGLVGPVVTALDVKMEANRRILAAYPSWKQANMLARDAELSRIQAGLMRDVNGDVMAARALSAEEIEEERALNAAWAWVGATRAASDAIEAQSPIPRDYTDDSYWPSTQ